MASLDIPDNIFGGLAKLKSLDEESFQKLISSLADAPLKIYQRKVLTEALSELSTLSPTDVENLVDALYGFYLGRAVEDVTVSTYAEDAVRTIEERGSEYLTFSNDDDRQQFKQRFIKLISSERLSLAAKAHHFLFQNAKNLSKARILTDIRPIFGEAEKLTPAGAIIVHRLKFEYGEHGRRQEFFVALDTKDVQDLIETLERAKSEAESLKSVLESAGVPYLEAE